MTFLQPWAVWFLAGIPLIILLYLLRLKRRAVTVSTHLFWQRVLQESSRRAFFHRLRHLLSLLLHLLIFLLIVGALARPLLRDAAQETGSTILLLDTRARMNAVEPDGQSRFAKAIALARTYARQANPRAEFALLTMDRNASVLVPFTDDERALTTALDSLACTDAAGELAEGLNLAHALLAGKSGERRIVVFTDRNLPPDPKVTVPITIHALGSSRENVAITRFASRPHPANPETAELLLEVQNFGAQLAQTELELQFDGRPFEVKPLSLDPGQKRVDVFSSVPRPGRASRGWLTAKLRNSDALSIDNTAFAALPLRAARRVLLVSQGNPFLEKLLAVDPSTKFQLIEPAAWNAELAAKFEVVIFDKFVPQNLAWETAPGNFLFLGATPFASASTTLDRPLITEVDANHPITRNVSLQNIAIQKAIPLAIPAAHDGWTFATPLRSFEHPLLILGASPTKRTAALAFDVLESDLPLRIAFPLLIANTLQWLDARESLPPQSIITGESLALTESQSISIVPLLASPKTAPTMQKGGIFQPLHNGFYLLADSSGQSWLSVNTFSPQESDLRIADAETVNTSVPVGDTRLGPWPPWLWLTLAAFALFTGEWWLFHRRKTE
jgi:Ca-activated chloride channel homolog